MQVGTEKLRTLGYAVTGTQSSIEALSLFQENPFAYNLIITDQTMPDITGYHLAQQCLAMRPDMPIIFAPATVKCC